MYETEAQELSQEIRPIWLLGQFENSVYKNVLSIQQHKKYTILRVLQPNLLMDLA